MRSSELNLQYAEHSASTANEARALLERIASTSHVVAPSDVEKVANATKVIAEKAGELSNIEDWELWYHALLVLATCLRRRQIALDGHGDTGMVREKLSFLLEDLRQQCHRAGGSGAANALVEASTSLLDKPELGTLISALAAIPLPTVYWESERAKVVSEEQVDEKSPDQQPTVVRIAAQLDGDPMTGPRIVRPQTVYALSFELCGMYWPRDAHELRLDLISTCPPELYQATSFVLGQPTDLFQYQGKLEGHMSFAQAQSSLSPTPLSFAIRAAFRCAGSWKPTPVVGCRELQFRVVDETSVPLFSGFRSIDQHVVQLVQKLLNDCPQVRSELPALLPMLTALSALLGTYAQGGVLKGATSMDEAEFQRNVVRDLRMKLGEDVEEHRHQAGGITDVRYRGVVAELKVEDRDGRRSSIGQKFAAQATQYQGSEGRQVGIVVVLDQTEKTLPPGDCRNDVLLVDVPTHGDPDVDKKHPSKVFVFVVNGNLKSPSEYSR